MLHLGIPDRDDWPNGVLAAVAQFRQGDLVSDLPLVFVGDPAVGVHALTRQANPDAGARGLKAPTAPYGMVLTQTCDLAQEGAGRPKSTWVQLCPVYDAASNHPSDNSQTLLRGDIRSLVKKGRYLSYLHVPDLPSSTEHTSVWYADLTFEVCADRGWLANQTRVVGFADEAQRVGVGKRLAWLRSRPAFDTRFVEAVQNPTRDAMKALRSENAGLFERLQDQVIEIGVLTASNISIATAEVTVICVAEPDDDVVAWWQNLWEKWQEMASDRAFTLMPLQLKVHTALPVSDHRQMTRVPLADLSPDPVWYGADPRPLEA